MKKISIKMAGFCCIAFSLLMHADTNQESMSQKEELSTEIIVSNGTGAYNYDFFPSFSEGHLFNALDFMTIYLPVNSTTLKTELEKISQYSDSSRDIAVRFWDYGKDKMPERHEASFLFLKSILNRNDFNANYIKTYLESKNYAGLNQFDAILQLEQNQFIQNGLNKDNVVVSVLKQIYHAVVSAYIIASNSSFSGDCVWAFVFQMYAIVLTGFFLVLNQSSWISKFSLVALVAAMVVAIGHIGGVSPPHWYQFDILNMLSKGWALAKYGMGTAAIALLTWFFYGLINQYRLDVARNLLRERTFSSETTNVPQLGDLVMDYVGGDLT